MAATVRYRVGGSSRERPDLEDDRLARKRIRSEHRIRLWTSLGLIAASVVIATVGASTGIDLGRALGEWRFGIVVLLGAALLFSYTLWLHLALATHGKIEDLEQRHASSAVLAEQIRRRLERRSSRPTSDK